MRITITGGAGFIGSTICQTLLAQGHALRVLDNLETGSRDNLSPEIPLVEGDLRDPAALEAAFEGAEVIIHQAAMVSVSRSMTEPERCHAINVQGTRQVLSAAMKAGCRRVVLASSAAVYGDAPELPKREALPPCPISPYAESKWLNELDARYFHRHAGLETVCLRYFNVFGPRQRPDSPYAGVISIAADRLLQDATFTVFGTGEQSRDFIFVEDLARAVAMASLSDHPALPGAVLNLGGERGLSLLELLETLGRLLERAPKLQFAPARAGDILHSLSDCSRARALLGEFAQTPMEEGLRRTLAWMARREPHLV